VTQQLTDFATINKVILKVSQIDYPPTAHICITETENDTNNVYWVINRTIALPTLEQCVH